MIEHLERYAAELDELEGIAPATTFTVLHANHERAIVEWDDPQSAGRLALFANGAHRVEVHWRVMPHSEVCMHMRVAGQQRWVYPLPHGMAQILNEDGSNFSIPVTRGEAGLPYDPISA